MLRCQDHATLHLCLRHTRQHPGEINDEVTTRMGDDGKVNILTLRHFLWQFQLQTLLLILFLVHCSQDLFLVKHDIIGEVEHVLAVSLHAFVLFL